jgi:hypothetical protein
VFCLGSGASAGIRGSGFFWRCADVYFQRFEHCHLRSDGPQLQALAPSPMAAAMSSVFPLDFAIGHQCRCSRYESAPFVFGEMLPSL